MALKDPILDSKKERRTLDSSKGANFPMQTVREFKENSNPSQIDFKEDYFIVRRCPDSGIHRSLVFHLSPPPPLTPTETLQSHWKGAAAVEKAAKPWLATSQHRFPDTTELSKQPAQQIPERQNQPAKRGQRRVKLGDAISRQHQSGKIECEPEEKEDTIKLREEEEERR